MKIRDSAKAPQKRSAGLFAVSVSVALCAGEVFEFLRFLNAPASIVGKAPSAGLYEGQTDEQEMGVSYRAIDSYINGCEVDEKDKAVIDRYHSRSEHKRRPISTFENP